MHQLHADVLRAGSAASSAPVRAGLLLAAAPPGRALALPDQPLVRERGPGRSASGPAAAGNRRCARAGCPRNARWSST